MCIVWPLADIFTQGQGIAKKVWDDGYSVIKIADGQINDTGKCWFNYFIKTYFTVLIAEVTV